MALEKKSKMAKIAEIFNLPPGTIVSKAKIAASLRTTPQNVENVYYMNQGLLHREGDEITILATGATSVTNNNLREAGQPAQSLQQEQMPRPRRVRYTGKFAGNKNSGTR